MQGKSLKPVFFLDTKFCYTCYYKLNIYFTVTEGLLLGNAHGHDTISVFKGII